MSGESSDAVQDTSTSTATSTCLNRPNRAGTCSSLADRPDRTAADVGSSDPTNAAALAVTSADFTSSSTRSLGDTSAIGTLALTAGDIPVEKSVRLRPLASYLDSLRETARAATQLQSAANQEECGLSAKSRSTKRVGQLLQNGGSSVAERSARYSDLRSQTTMDRNARGSPAPYARTEATREHHSRRAIRPRPVRVQGGKSSPRFLAYNHTERFGSPMLLAAEGDMNELVGDEEYDSMLTSNLDLFSGYRGG
ncbi:hypothetical protein EVJ58_g2553 [Rhodofomes roseus]|uniref:Uncharacterized protein n=1 Tax=Rhodofomes roseus TaxID=34475 RepID=A0A4Y9YSQ1_9APHY|nr:hypothetical protein EVJ58_g2553 [Rhodofomes roseus]